MDQEKPKGELSPLRRTSGLKQRRLERRALRWPLKPEVKAAIVNRQARDALDPKLKPRDRARSAKVLIDMEKQNIDLEAIDLKELQGAGATQVNIQNNFITKAPEDMTLEELKAEDERLSATIEIEASASRADTPRDL